MNSETGFLMDGSFSPTNEDETELKFKSRFGERYYPDNVGSYDWEDEDEGYTFEDFKTLCETEWNENEDLQNSFKTHNTLLNLLICVIDWQHPSTVIEEIKIDLTE